jgi:hypothetical protein
MSGEGAKSGSHKALIIGVIALVVTLVILFIPMIPVDATYNDTEPYDRLGKYEVVSATLTQEYELLGRGVYHRSTVIVKNIDSYGGTFTVNHYLYDVNGLFGTKTTSAYIGAGNTQNFVAEFDTSLGQDVRAEYSVSAPTVVDQRVVTKHKTVYKSIIELLVYH